MSIRDQTAIVGIAQTAFRKGHDDSELSLACQAISAAIDDAGLSPSEIDGLASYTLEGMREVEVARNVGLGDVTFFSQVCYGGGAGCGTVGHAVEVALNGLWRCILVEPKACIDQPVSANPCESRNNAPGAKASPAAESRYSTGRILGNPGEPGSAT